MTSPNERASRERCRTTLADDRIHMMNDEQLNDVWNKLLADLPRYGELDSERRAAIGETLRETELGDVEAVDEFLDAIAPKADGREHVFSLFLQHSLQPWLMRDEHHVLSERAVSRLVDWYRTPGCESLVRFPILRTLAVDGHRPALAALADLIVADPPTDERQAVMSLVPLFQPRSPSLPGGEVLFPRLFDALSSAALAPVVLDLANFLVRRGVLAEHPAQSRAGELATLLGSLAARLQKIEENPAEYATNPQELSRTVNEAVTLVVSLCDALALAGNRSVVGKLRRVLDLHHRRVQTEGAAALARLGEEEGFERLKSLAKEPVVRTRALYYLDELGATDKVDESLRSPEARAEGDLAAWMAQPTRFGVAPDTLELIDRTKQYWPGYVDPVECFLFVYEYQRGPKTIGGVGLTGPTTNALQVDLQDLPPSDIYALYAGLDSEHADIYETTAEDLSPDQQDAWNGVSGVLKTQGYEELELAIWGHFFGEQFAVASAVHNGRPGVIVIADDHSEWFSLPVASRAFGPREVYAMFKGRKLLKAFNKDEGGAA
ncbi:MAG: HEAT repeat domain-containing protein [Planctomycetaceae bacterium]|nr:HEAT repeat domain-containing protein [Planctomycetaceae bacterium]